MGRSNRYDVGTLFRGCPEFFQNFQNILCATDDTRQWARERYQITIEPAQGGKWYVDKLPAAATRWRLSNAFRNADFHGIGSDTAHGYSQHCGLPSPSRRSRLMLRCLAGNGATIFLRLLEMTSRSRVTCAHTRGGRCEALPLWGFIVQPRTTVPRFAALQGRPPVRAGRAPGDAGRIARGVLQRGRATPAPSRRHCRLNRWRGHGGRALRGALAFYGAAPQDRAAICSVAGAPARRAGRAPGDAGRIARGVVRRVSAASGAASGRPGAGQPTARAAITPAQTAPAVSTVPQARSAATMAGCQSRITAQEVSS
jgi:hypothetical protein